MEKEKFGKTEVSYVRIEIENSEFELIGIGIEIGRKDNNIFYHDVIMSLAVRNYKFDSTFKLLEYAINEALKYIPETVKLVIFTSTNQYFKYHKRLKKDFIKKAGDKELLFFHFKNKSISTITLAQDALKPNRRDSIVEILRGN